MALRSRTINEAPAGAGDRVLYVRGWKVRGVDWESEPAGAAPAGAEMGGALRVAVNNGSGDHGGGKG